MSIGPILGQKALGIAVSVLAFFPFLVLAQTSTITGTVTDSTSGAALPGVTVTLTKWAQQGKWNWGTVTIGSTQTDAQGHYSLTGLEPTATWESYTLAFSKTGYNESSIMTFALTADTTRIMNKRLIRTAGVLVWREVSAQGLQVSINNGRIVVDNTGPACRLMVFAGNGRKIFSELLPAGHGHYQMQPARTHQPMIIQIRTGTWIFNAPLFFW
jgi:5-hydroxyisourate hydrolase-like protein (transthyretin family)